MDSLSQVALGSAVGIAVMGRRVPLWKAALVGAVVGTLPDLDSFIDHGDPIRNMTFHRAESHALFYLTLLSPLLALLITRLCGALQDFKRWWLTVWLVLVTHALLDLMTVYGTQLALPFSDYPFGIGSIFIIDPIYTLPLLIGVVAAIFLSKTSGLKWNKIGLAFSSAYLCFGVIAQQHVKHIALDSLAENDFPVEKLLVTPTPFNTLLWRVLAMTPEGYAEGYYSLLDDEPKITFTIYPRDKALYQAVQGNWEAERIAWFSHGFFKMQDYDGKIVITDLRMGQEPYYSFNFLVAEKNGEHINFVKPQLEMERPEMQPALAWLWRRLQGNLIDPPWAREIQQQNL